MLQLFAGSFFPGWAAVLTHVNQQEEISTLMPSTGRFWPPCPLPLERHMSEQPGQSAQPRAQSFLNSGWWEGTRPVHRVR